MILVELFFGFLRVGCFAFGGAYAAIPLIRDVVLSYGWLDEQVLTDMIAVSESTPGPIMVNLATYVGSSRAGFGGAVLATLAVVLPSFVIVLLATAALNALLRRRCVQAALRGMKPCVIGVILATGVSMAVKNCLPPAGEHFDPRALGITAVLLAAAFAAKPLLGKKPSPIALIAAAAALGLLLY